MVQVVMALSVLRRGWVNILLEHYIMFQIHLLN